MSRCSYCGAPLDVIGGDGFDNVCDDCIERVDPVEAAYREAEEMDLHGQDAADYVEDSGAYDE